MVKREKPKYIYQRILKSQAEEERQEYSVSNELEKISNKWNSRYNEELAETIKIFHANGSNIQSHILKVNPNRISLTKSKDCEHKFHKLKAEYKIRIPHQFIELGIEIIPNESSEVNFIDFEDDLELLNLKTEEFHEIENSERRIKYLVVREQIQNLIHEIWDTFRLPGCEIKIIHKRLHFVDSTTGIVHRAVYQIISEILNIEAELIKNSVLNKFKSFNYFFETMDYKYIEHYQSAKRTTYNGLRLIPSDDYKDPFALLRSKMEANSQINIELSNLFKEYSGPHSVTMCAPVYHDALVFKNNKGRIEGTFNICFDCNSIENNHRILMNTNTELFNNLRKIIPADNNI